MSVLALPALPEPRLGRVALAAVEWTQQNPRADMGDDELPGLAASLGAPDAALLVQLPAVEEVSPGMFRSLWGARRLQAAHAQHWLEVPCLIYPPLDPVQAHLARLAENLHRRPINPLDEALSLRIAWAVALAEALQVGAEARALIGNRQPLAETLTHLTTLVEQHGFRVGEGKPPVTWNDVLDRLGVTLQPYARKRLMRVLRVDPALYQRLRAIPDITEAALRAVGTLPVAAQAVLVAALEANPALIRKIRRICRVVAKKQHTIESAIAEAAQQVARGGNGLVYGFGDEDEDDADGARRQGDDAGPSADTEDRAEAQIEAHVFALTETAARLVEVLTELGDLDDLPEPWDMAARDAVQLIREVL